MADVEARAGEDASQEGIAHFQAGAGPISKGLGAPVSLEITSSGHEPSIGDDVVYSSVNGAIETTRKAERLRRQRTRRSIAAAFHASHVLTMMKRKVSSRRRAASAAATTGNKNADTKSGTDNSATLDTSALTRDALSTRLSPPSRKGSFRRRKRISRQVTQLLSVVSDASIDYRACEIDTISHTSPEANPTKGLFSQDGTQREQELHGMSHIRENDDSDSEYESCDHVDDQESNHSSHKRSQDTPNSAKIKRAQQAFADQTGGADVLSTHRCTTRCAFMPGSLALGLWDLFIGTFVLAQLVYAVMVMCFSDQIFPTIMLLVSGSVRVCVNLLDFIFNTRIAYVVPLEPAAIKAFRTLGARESGSERRHSLRRKQFGNGLQPKNQIEGNRITAKTRASMRQMAVFENLTHNPDDTMIVTNVRALLDDYVLSQGLSWFCIDLVSALLPAELLFSAVFHANSEFLEQLDPSVRARLVTNQTSDPSAPTAFLFFLLFLPAILKAAKLLTTSRLSDSISHTLSRLRTAGGSAENVLSVLWLFAFLLIFAHTAACFFYLIARYEAFSANSRTGEQPLPRYSATNNGEIDPPSWVHAQGLENEGFLPRFVTALYWSTVTLTSTGYGDVIPVTYLERWYNVVVCLLGALVYATIFGRVTTMFNSMNTMNDLYRKKFTQVNRFMAVYGLPNEMRLRIRRQLKFDWTLTSGINVDDVISELPYSLQVEVRRAILQDSLENMPLMQQIGHEAITALLMFMNVRQCISGTCIIKEGDPATQMFFVKSGRLAVLKDGKKIHTLAEGAIFGEVGLLLGLARTASIVSETRSVYFALAGDAYARIMCMYPQFHELLERRALARLQGAIDSDARAASLVHKIATTTITKTNSIVASELLVDKAVAMAERAGVELDHENFGVVAPEKLEAGKELVGEARAEKEMEEQGPLERGPGRNGPDDTVPRQLLAQMTQLLGKVQRMEDQIEHLTEMDRISSTTERWRAWNV